MTSTSTTALGTRRRFSSVAAVVLARKHVLMGNYSLREAQLYPREICTRHARLGPVSTEPGSGGTGSLVRIRCIWRTVRQALTLPGLDGMMPPREGPPMERHRDRLSRRQFVVGAGASSAALLAGCGRWPGQAQAP